MLRPIKFNKTIVEEKALELKNNGYREQWFKILSERWEVHPRTNMEIAKRVLLRTAFDWAGEFPEYGSFYPSEVRYRTSAETYIE